MITEEERTGVPSGATRLRVVDAPESSDDEMWFCLKSLGNLRLGFAAGCEALATPRRRG
jgi:hypothetical protein